MKSVIDSIIDLLKVGPWHARNLCVKTVCVLYRDTEDKWYMAQHGVLEAIFALIDAKNPDLQEAPLVALLSLCSHADVPPLFMEKGGLKLISDVMIYTLDEVVRDLSIVLMKGIALYNAKAVRDSVPDEKQHLLARDPDVNIVYGSEYGEMIEEYLQRIIENRRDQHYLLEQFTDSEVRLR